MSSESMEATKPAANTAEKKPARKKRARVKSAKKQPTAKPAKKRAVRKAAAKATPKKRRPAKRTQTSAAQRTHILEVAGREGLTALEVQQRFGVIPVTYYSWRKKAGLKGRRGRRPAAQLSGNEPWLTSDVRTAVERKVREVVPEIVKREVDRVLGALLGR